MDEFIQNLAKAHFGYHRRSFGEDAVFQRFLQADGSVSVANMYPAVVYGYYVYNVADGIRISNRIRVQYFVSNADVRPKLSQWFNNEATFYGLIWPNLCLTEQTKEMVPKFCVSSAYTTPTANVAAMIFESPRGYLNWGYSRCLDYEHKSLMARKIGQFHGCVLETEATKAQTLVRMQGWRELYSQPNCQLLQPTLQRCLEGLHSDPLYAENESFAAGAQRLATMVASFEKDVAMVTSDSDNCFIMCHMNYSQASVFFKYDGVDVVDAKIGNWGTAGFGSLGADLVILLFVEGDVTAGHGDWRQLLNDYYEALKNTCPPMYVPQLREIIGEIKRSVPIALFALAARIVGLDAAPCLSRRRYVSTHWNDEFVTTLYKQLILNNYV